MANDFYNHANFPGTRASLSSAAMSAELESIQQGFDKIAPLTGYGGYFLRVNAGESAYEAVAPASVLASLDADLVALAAVSATGMLVRTGSGTADARTIQVTAGTGLQITNGDGVSGNPVLAGLDASDTVKGVVELATSAETQTGTDTARAVTPAGLAATAMYQGKQTLHIPATAMVVRVTNGPAAGTVETTTNKVMVKTLDFDQSTAEYAQFSIRMPKSWDEGTVTAEFQWSSNVSGTNSVVWALRAVAISDDDALDSAFGTAVTVTDAQTAQGDLMKTAETGAMTIAGSPAVGDWVVFEVYRDAANGSDTLAGDARLHGVTIFYTTDGKNDA